MISTLRASALTGELGKTHPVGSIVPNDFTQPGLIEKPVYILQSSRGQFYSIISKRRTIGVPQLRQPTPTFTSPYLGLSRVKLDLGTILCIYCSSCYHSPVFILPSLPHSPSFGDRAVPYLSFSAWVTPNHLLWPHTAKLNSFQLIPACDITRRSAKRKPLCNFPSWASTLT